MAAAVAIPDATHRALQVIPSMDLGLAGATKPCEPPADQVSGDDRAGHSRRYQSLGLSSRANLLLSILFSMALLVFLSRLTVLTLPDINYGETFRDCGRRLLAGFLAGMIAHELLHYLGFRAGGVSARDVGFGVKWAVLVPFVYLKRPVNTRVYRLGLLLPLVVLGVLPYCLALGAGYQELAIWSAVMISASGGDVFLFLLTLRQPTSALILDLNDGIGAAVLVEEEKSCRDSQGA